MNFYRQNPSSRLLITVACYVMGFCSLTYYSDCQNISEVGLTVISYCPGNSQRDEQQGTELHRLVKAKMASECF